MEKFIGIDLGTTNSVICSYDDNNTQIWKSPEQNDVTPSAIYIDRNGNKYVGQRAYNAAPRSPDRCATLFKRHMGTSTPIELSDANHTFTPEECSAEVLKALFGYLPEEIRNDPETGTVITVPAAFNQMQKNATVQAAEMAGIGKVALMQEPVAAVMSVMRTRDTDGIFLIYDIGGGTLDIAIAESIGGTVTLLTQGGIQMCGGRDFDRILMDNHVRPWLLENFDLPEDLTVNPIYKPLIRLATWAAEHAKIELSAKEDAMISLDEIETRTRDLSGDEIYLNIPLQRDTFDSLISDRIEDTITAARETLSEAGLTPNDVAEIVWIGGPTNYKPLRDKVAFELGIRGDRMTVNPMTTVAEGASVFSESVDWSSQNRSRKESRGQISSGGALSLTFNYIARTPRATGKIAVQAEGPVATGSEFQIDSLDTGWTSGRLPLKHGATVDVTLTKPGENTFKVFVYDPVGGPIAIEQNEITITRTAATVDAIPASHRVSLAVWDEALDRAKLLKLAEKGDPLPKKEVVPLKTLQSMKAGSSDSLVFYLWEGDIEDPITDNRMIGALKVSGTDFEDGTIPEGADIDCHYEILDSGELKIEVSIPAIHGLFDSTGKNFYLHQEGFRDYSTDTFQVTEEGTETRDRIQRIIDKGVNAPKLEDALEKLQDAITLDPEETDPEKVQAANEGVSEARKLLSDVRKEHGSEIRQIDLDDVYTFFDKYVRQHARSSEAEAFDNLVETAQCSIDNNSSDFDHHLSELRGRNFEILWRQDWYVIEQFRYLSNSRHLFADQDRFDQLVHIGNKLMEHEDIQRIIAGNESTIKSEVVEQLRGIVVQMWQIPRIATTSDDNEFNPQDVVIVQRNG